MTRPLRRFFRFLAGFFEIRAEQSMSRLVMLVCALGALWLVRSIDRLTQRPHLTDVHVAMVRTVGVVLGVLIIQGAVALAMRARAAAPAAVPDPAAPADGETP